MRIPRRDLRRATGVTLVEADDIAAPAGQPLAELLRPPEHRRPAPHDEQHRRMCRVAEGLGRDEQSLVADETFAHCAPSLSLYPRGAGPYPTAGSRAGPDGQCVVPRRALLNRSIGTARRRR